MATIAISDLSPAGYDLFSDNESFMSELTEQELGLEGGGITIVTTSSQWCVGASVAASAWAASYIWGRNR